MLFETILLCTCRTEEEEKWDVKLFNKKSKDVRKKLNILPSLG